ncbi:MAG: DNA translocase FtsK 4TM domain-containing protein [Acidobacteria bacterium]|nr:DNA translocase FtsK 4TM domain-containing protein [Acidobacteriota bacterium]
MPSVAVSGSALSRRVSEVVGVGLFAVALIWLVALASYDAHDPAWFFSTGASAAPANFAGRVGAFLAELSFQVLGYASFLIPAMIAVAGWRYFWCRPLTAAYTKLTGAALMFGCASAFMAITLGRIDSGPRAFRAGGYLGEWLGGLMSDYLSRTGSAIVLVAVMAGAVILATQFSFGHLFQMAFAAMGVRVRESLLSFKNWREERRKVKQRHEVFAKHGKADSPEAKAVAKPVVKPAPVATPKPVARPVSARTDDEEDVVPVRNTPPVVQKPRQPSTQPLPLPEPDKSPAERRLSGFMLPPLTLLDPPRAESKIDERELMESARLLEEKCREFSVEGCVAQIHPGPVVTTFEFKPDAGVKYSKVTGLSDDLCLAMQAESVLIDRIPGKSTVGIQIPNPNREAISLRELLESDHYTRTTSKLTLALGKSIHGEPYMADLATMPHLLIAGSTGTGKSVGLNAMLTSLLYRATPDDVRMIMIDPKRLELGMYDDIPHLLTPVVVDPKKAANALRWAVREMEERYKTLAAFGVRNIEQYNRNVRAMLEAKDLPTEGEPPKPLPFIVVVVDELADLMMVAGNEVEESICRLAQMARAVGIHLILATQRPSVDVITGLIKANLPSRISFRVSSKIDSRTILDSNGAEQLLGKGDMLFLPPASSRHVRLHGPYISEQESARLASFLRKQGRPAFDETITADDKKDGPEGIEYERDELYDEAARIVVQNGQASISYLQRKMRIGFSRAARLVDMMEMEGLVSPATGGKAREVLVPRDYFDAVDAQLR